MSTTTEPKSVRLNQTHRADMINAVMAEWERQNPAPASPDHISLLEIVADQLKKHAAYKRTQRMIAALEPDDFHHVSTEVAVNAAIMNKQGEQRNTLRVYFPRSIASRLGLQGIPGRHRTIFTAEFAPADLDPADIEGYEDLNPKTYRVPQQLQVKCIVFVDRNYPTVQIDDSSAPMIARKEARRARKEWEAERDALGRETRDLLENFNTTKQLRDGWPDMVPYLPPHIADPERGLKLPVLETSRLSQRLGITDKAA